MNFICLLNIHQLQNNEGAVKFCTHDFVITDIFKKWIKQNKIDNKK